MKLQARKIARRVGKLADAKQFVHINIRINLLIERTVSVTEQWQFQTPAENATVYGVSNAHRAVENYYYDAAL